MNILKYEFYIQKIKFLNFFIFIDELRINLIKIQTVVD